ncbi:LysR family transcriptional regulator [Bradyrhizobium sp. U87765 SZCCT0131]|uniref:LysR family transcriptional regulator n=1 Tax=unclassified Bradyrhizobium TaxID=2631580 RepID=UPI001BA48042|nr:MULTISPECIES: LysR family transcriptional regulator [unclassified Bradyrhizobium]MBR1221965.1 LysR family transcriptional regulator [Bradyrhizobium sp. U87765 SZCCT0131]MBR1263837.1 LysR family transcriptional regulator [Bradyrhizobium sp. U87765 SZCCT0134]MBR1302593.1 LysR family transcriptional regulator [Bradyrhizobium sp. U87765 SZCCT0110]MBR1320087.1 LysR family transcriptional regulator [Bradyrhizobium sp. U87765 SZCCT0109]MBR1348800.1 LysR family transcriptional regulator [Bradyrhizo
MDLRQLRYFAVLAEEKHFGRAAQRLALSQPPLSTAIRQLEAEIGAKLFARTSRHVSLTPAGVALQREAQVLLRRADEARALVKAVAEGHGARFRVGFAGSMLYRGLPALLADVGTLAPDIELTLQELNSTEQIEALHRDEIDLGFIHGRSTPDGLDGFRYHAEPFVACVPDGHAAARARTLRLTRLQHEDFVLFSQRVSPDYFQSVMAICLAAGFMPRVRHEVRHWLSVVSFVANGLGVALVPRTLATSHLAGATFVPIERSDILSETWCVWKAGEARPALDKLIHAARARSRALKQPFRS